MTHPTITSELAAAWDTVRQDVHLSSCQLEFFDDNRGFLFLECRSLAYKTTVRLAESALRDRLNSHLAEPVVQRIVPYVLETRVLVTGSRAWDNQPALADMLLEAWYDAVQDGIPRANFRVIHGDCPKGADALAKQWAIDNNLTHIPVPAEWSAPCTDRCPPNDHRKTSARHGDYCPLAGHHRNQQMVDMRPDLVLAFRRNDSRGTSDCISRATRAGIPIRILEDNHG